MKEEDQKKIKILHDGPYEVTGNVPLNQLRFVADKEDDGAVASYQLVKKYPLQDTYHLCRCGKSTNKPFCDGSHYQGFDGTETAGHKTYDEMAGLIEGKVIDMLDAEELCAVARFCDTYSTSWNLVEDGVTEEAKNIVIQQCKDCPSGRLTAVTKEGKRIEPELPQEISILEDTPEAVHGPIWVKGGILIEDEHGKAYPVRNRVTLCRCGKSTNKPFCDAKHIENSGELKEEEI
jgi:CDGSH-type Zn-finger protein